MTAYSAANVDTADVARAAADKPLLVATNALESPAADARWTMDGVYSGQDYADEAYPTRWAYDRRTNLWTRPLSSASASTWYLCFQVDPDTAFDVAAIIGHNFDTLNATVSLQIAEDEAFSVNLVTLCSWTPTTLTRRKVSRALGIPTYPAAQQFSSVFWARLKVTQAGGTPISPQVGEVILGQRRQLYYKSRIPIDDQAQQSDTTDTRAKSSARTRYVRSHGQAITTIRRAVGTTAEVSVIRSWFDDCEHGTKPFLYIEDPASSLATTAYWMFLTDPRLELPLQGPIERAWEAELEEDPPFASGET